MCSSFFSQRMDNDLDGRSDIVLAGGGVGASSTAHTVANSQFWPETATLPSLADGYLDNFGDVNPFVNFHDPLLHGSFLGASDRMVHLARTSVDGGDGKLGGGSRSKADEGSVTENSRGQISSPRSLGTKKMLRKNQAIKKVVCIPAPAPASSKTTGEVVPSDLWAWRKYGQKPIKGSPYPRSYYRCSSSKGCSARKQVERSRADPTTLVITYTSEHNHPRPTQRNALAGSTRAQYAKNDSPASKDSRHNRGPPSNLKELQSKGSTPMVKEEAGGMETAIGIGDGDEFDLIFNQSFKHVMLELNHSDDFFTDLGELEAGPLMDLHLTKEFLGNKSDDEERENKVLDPFSFFDWAGNSIGEAK